VAYINSHEMPDLISLDHDLKFEHYPTIEEEMKRRSTGKIPYETFKEKTGLDAISYIIKNKLPIKYWAIHSANPVGSKFMHDMLHSYRPQGEVRMAIPFQTTEQQTYGGRIEEGLKTNEPTR